MSLFGLVNRSSLELNDIRSMDDVQAHCSTNCSIIDNKLEPLVSNKTMVEAVHDTTAADDEHVKLPSLADLYMKDTRTLNTNVLVHDEEEELTTDSEKFLKPDNYQQQQLEPYEQHINDILSNTAKGGAVKSTDETNFLEHNLDDKFKSDNAQKKFLFSELMARSCDIDGNKQQQDNINNIKRMKIDEDSKNARMQSKLNTNINMISGGIVEVPCDIADSTLIEVRDCGNTMTRLHGVGPLPTDGHVRTAMIREADHSWHNYLADNNSVVVDTFQGQFKSTVSKKTIN